MPLRSIFHAFEGSPRSVGFNFKILYVTTGQSTKPINY